MKHYVCKGECKGVSDKPCNCGDEDCSSHRIALLECNCKDGKHKEVLEN